MIVAWDVFYHGEYKGLKIKTSRNNPMQQYV
jgi:hypothetical protein